MPGNKGRMGGERADERTGGRADGGGWGRMGGRADRSGRADRVRMGGGWEADGRTGGMANERTGADGVGRIFQRVKLLI